jgi:hypothetical protein
MRVGRRRLRGRRRCCSSSRRGSPRRHLRWQRRVSARAKPRSKTLAAPPTPSAMQLRVTGQRHRARMFSRVGACRAAGAAAFAAHRHALRKNAGEQKQATSDSGEQRRRHRGRRTVRAPQRRRRRAGRRAGAPSAQAARAAPHAPRLLLRPAASPAQRRTHGHVGSRSNLVEGEGAMMMPRHTREGRTCLQAHCDLSPPRCQPTQGCTCPTGRTMLRSPRRLARRLPRLPLPLPPGAAACPARIALGRLPRAAAPLARGCQPRAPPAAAPWRRRAAGARLACAMRAAIRRGATLATRNPGFLALWC